MLGVGLENQVWVCCVVIRWILMNSSKVWSLPSSYTGYALDWFVPGPMTAPCHQPPEVSSAWTLGWIAFHWCVFPSPSIRQRYTQPRDAWNQMPKWHIKKVTQTSRQWKLGVFRLPGSGIQWPLETNGSPMKSLILATWLGIARQLACFPLFPRVCGVLSSKSPKSSNPAICMHLHWFATVLQVPLCNAVPGESYRMLVVDDRARNTSH